MAKTKMHATHRRYEEEDGGPERACGHWFEYTLVVGAASLLLLGALVLALFWALYYGGGFAWADNPERQFNLHPVLMTAGFITFSGFSILLYRLCRCCRRLHVKLLHTVFHALALPCVAVAFWAAFDWHNRSSSALPHFYSLHSWMGLVTMGLFALQFVVGFFSFLVLLCCEGATAAFRASLVPIHATFGITTFMLAVATCLTGLTQKAYERFGEKYSTLPEEAIVFNTLAIVLTLSAVVVAYAVLREDFRYRGHILVSSDGDPTPYPSSWSEEGIILNALAMVLVALGILLSYAVRRDWQRGEAKSYLSERL